MNKKLTSPAMWLQLKRWFTPPIFDNDQEKTFRARLIYVISFLLTILLGLNITFLLTTPQNLWMNLLLDILLLVTLVVCLYWTKQGHVRWPGQILSLILWMVVTFSIILYGPRDVIVSGYIITIIVATLLSDGLGSLLSIVMSTLVLALLVSAEITGLRPPSLPVSLPVILRVNIQLFAATGLLLYVTTRAITQALTQARQNEQALRASEERLNHILAMAPISMGLTTLEGRFFQVNEAMCQMLGYSKAELLTKTFSDITYPEDREFSLQVSQKLLDGHLESLQYEKRYQAKNGRIVWGITTIQLVHDEMTENAYFIRQIQDISNRKEVEALLQQQQNHLEELVQERTAELQQTNHQLQQEIVERRSVEAELRLHEAIIENMAEGVHLVRIDDGTIIYTNPTLERMFGYQPDEILGQHVSILNAPAGTSPEETANEIIKSLLDTGYWKGEIYNVKKNGEIFCCAAHVSTFHHDQYGAVWVSVHEDITQRKLVEKELAQYRQHLQEMVNHQTAELKTVNDQLRLTEERYRAIAELTSDFAYSTQITPEGTPTLEWITPAFTRILGYLPEQMGKTIGYLDTVHPSDAFLVKNRMESLISGVPTVTEYRCITRNGEIHWLRDYGQPIWDEKEQRVVRIYGAAQDITLQKEAEAKLLAERTLLQTVIDNLPDYFYLKDLNHQIILSNKSYAQSLGVVTAKELIGKTLADFYPLQEAERFNALDRYILASGREVINQENSFIDLTTGQRRWSLLTRLPFRDMNGAIAGVVGVSRDITERKQAELLLQNRLNFETLVANSSANFIRLSAEEVDQGINDTIQRIAQLTGAARSSIFLFSDDLQTFSNTHEWCADPKDSQKAQLQGFSTSLFGWYFNKLNHLETFLLKRPDELPLEAVGEWEWIKQNGFRALLFVPMIKAGKLAGALGFYGRVGQTVEWPNEYIALLQLVADIIMNALIRKWTEEQIKTSLNEKEVLLREIHHRVKNNLQVISSLLDLQSTYVKEESVWKMFQESRSRIRSIALVHEQLYQSTNLARVDFADYVRNLAGYLSRVYEPSSNQVTLSANVEDIPLSIETAIPLGLILNELVSNAYKHAFPNGRFGHIALHLRKKGDHQIYMAVQDNGIGFSATLDLNTSSLGLTIIMTLVGQLKGEIQLRRQDGTCFELTFPI